MSETETKVEVLSPEVTDSGILGSIVIATPQTQPDRTTELMRTLMHEAMRGTVTYDRNLVQTLNSAIERIDRELSRQLAAVMQHPAFQKLEGSWRGLHHLVTNSETGSNLKVRMMNITKPELHKSLTTAVEFDQSVIFKKIYEDEFGTPGGEPYAALIGDYEFSASANDVETLICMAQVSAASFAPFIAAAAPTMFGLSDYTELSRPRDLSKIFESQEYIKLRSFRESDDARFVTLVMPRVLARLPYGRNGRATEVFDFDEAVREVGGPAQPLSHGQFTWMNAAYVLGTRLTDAFAAHGWCTAIRGAEGGGKVRALPSYAFVSDDGDIDQQCPTEIGITDRREAELSRLGFLPLCHYKHTDYAVFFGAQSLQKPTVYDRPEATANAAISARLPYVMAMSRFAHFLKVMARDKVGSFVEAGECEAWLNRWIMNYVNGNEGATQDVKAKYPLAEAKVSVREIPGQPGSYHAIAWLRPWLQMEELTTSMRLVARIPRIE
ncbi:MULTISPECIES: type VI secretion system contractile sheath large subunit [unclassified Chelatococcus]|uniref:type VI secretion system contractile sheath large subunit n=1 Tax=unclassified Chelatococcus TaxID=2638111 RepID=UPI001BCE3ADC|nr:MULTISPECIES: type VI secretion system contractile sheath large subunit [unclassified Chelatococcus]CAH1653467.1 Type VI secretion system sheath protein TssC1 [Hyphomicrobiales bacterium]MBS7740123.1 type VI secretion system contractile sheath large subunit [Chelatococcus sp. HY11]MBX3545048.1 type VI secretion system contractile sheath large subunit [Chelatococcus sp.]MCO5078577.1 type VI secretion system contractile sheath large subunit [Chelatococcus sp.]CAH1685694.1 Type VI secretion sy